MTRLFVNEGRGPAVLGRATRNLRFWLQAALLPSSQADKARQGPAWCRSPLQEPAGRSGRQITVGDEPACLAPVARTISLGACRDNSAWTGYLTRPGNALPRRPGPVQPPGWS